MPRTLIAIALSVLAMPAIAMAQHPSSNEQPHPAISAHANAQSAQADTARIIACGSVTSSLVANLDKGDFKAATTDFDTTMLANLGADKLAKVWQSIGAQAGKLVGHGAPQNAMYQGFVVITLPLRFERANLDAQVACDAKGKVAGFHLLPVTAPDASH